VCVCGEGVPNKQEFAGIT